MDKVKVESVTGFFSSFPWKQCSFVDGAKLIIDHRLSETRMKIVGNRSNWQMIETA